MAGFSDYFANKILDHMRGAAYPPPAGLYVGLFSSPPTDAGGGTEITATIRPAGRQAASFSAANARAIANSAVVDFGASAGTASITHFGVFDAASGGNLLGWNVVTTALAITPNINVVFATGELIVTIPRQP